MSNPIAEVIQQTESRFKELQPAGMKYEAEKGFAIQILKNNDYLMQAATASPTSLQQALTNVAAIGLSLNPAAKEAYLIPRNVKDGNNWVKRVFLEPSYMGMVKLATDSGGIKWVQAGYVCDNDKFIDNGPGNNLTHEYQAFGDRGAIVGFYCVAKTHEDDYLVDTMTVEETDKIRDRSESWKRGQKGPWLTDYNEQAKKTVVRRAFKMWPKTDQHRMAQAVELSNDNEGFEPLVTSPTINEGSPDQKQYFDQLIENGDALGMFIFLESLEQSVQVSLNRSFERGSIGKYQKLVNTLKEEGRSFINQYVTELEGYLGNDDDLACAEIMNDFDQAAQKMIYSRLNGEASTALKLIMEKV